jgi:hypothetical protein
MTVVRPRNRSYFLHVHERSKNITLNIDSLLKNGPPEHGVPDMSAGAMWAESATLSASYQYCGEAQGIAGILGALPEFPGMKKMLDLGGGAGFFAMAIVRSHPHMTGVVFEQRAVAAVSRGFISEYEMEDQFRL